MIQVLRVHEGSAEAWLTSNSLSAHPQHLRNKLRTISSVQGDGVHLPGV
jgi:hypothetical protein